MLWTQRLLSFLCYDRGMQILVVEEEMRMAEALMRNPGRPIGRDSILESVGEAAATLVRDRSESPCGNLGLKWTSADLSSFTRFADSDA